MNTNGSKQFFKFLSNFLTFMPSFLNIITAQKLFEEVIIDD